MRFKTVEAVPEGILDAARPGRARTAHMPDSSLGGVRSRARGGRVALGSPPSYRTAVTPPTGAVIPREGTVGDPGGRRPPGPRLVGQLGDLDEHLRDP
jgi:hypothetical protein